MAGDVLVGVTEYRVSYAASTPAGKSNAALPALRLRVDTPHKSFTLHRPAQLSLDAQTNVPQRKEEHFEEAIDDKKNIPMKTFATSEPDPAWDPPADPEMDREAPLLLRFTAKNIGLEPQRLVLSLRGEGERNYWAPVADVTVELAAKTERDVITLAKRDPEKDWGEVNYAARVEAPVTFGPKGESDTDYKDSMGGYYAVDEATMPISDVVSVDDDLRPASGQISCPACTFLNASVALKCEMCNTVFKSIA